MFYLPPPLKPDNVTVRVVKHFKGPSNDDDELLSAGKELLLA